jgi:hypothetical protein
LASWSGQALVPKFKNPPKKMVSNEPAEVLKSLTAKKMAVSGQSWRPNENGDSVQAMTLWIRGTLTESTRERGRKAIDNGIIIVYNATYCTISMSEMS